MCYHFRLHRQDFNVLSETSTRVCIISSASVVGAPVGIAGASLTLTAAIIKKY